MYSFVFILQCLLYTALAENELINNSKEIVITNSSKSLDQDYSVFKSSNISTCPQKSCVAKKKKRPKDPKLIEDPQHLQLPGFPGQPAGKPSNSSNSTILPPLANNTLIPTTTPDESLTITNPYKTTDKTLLLDVETCADLNKTEKTPFIVLIIVETSGRLLCMGSIIDKFHILTARTCFADVINIGSLVVVANYLSPYFGRNSQVKFVSKIINHELQLSLLLLERPLIFGLGVRPVQIMKFYEFQHPYPKPDIDDYFVVGFKLSKFVMQTEEIKRLRVYQVKKEPLMEKEVCAAAVTKSKNELYKKIYDEEFMFCSTGATDFCWTAMGSPTLLKVNGRYVQFGLVWGASCESNPEKTEEQNKPETTMHVRVDKLYEWIQGYSFSIR